MTLARKFVAPISSFRYHQLPGDVLDKAKLCLIHGLACTYAGRRESWSTATREITARINPRGPASIWFTNQTSGPADAAFVNAAAAQSILHEDIHRDSNAHPGIIVIPAVLATAEMVGANGQAVLAALVSGYEMMGRIGRGTVNPAFGAHGYRPTSFIGVFGAAVASGILLRLDFTGQMNAFGLAANHCCGINQWAIGGTDDLYIQNASAARSGVLAALLAERGISAPWDILEGQSGFCNAYDFSRERLEEVDFSDGNLVIRDILFKPAPACALVQTTAQAALDARRLAIDPNEIESGTIYTFALGKTYAGCDYAGPFNRLLQARMSNQFNFAASMIHNRIANENYVAFSDHTVQQLASRMRVEIDDAYTAAFPASQSVRIELKLRDGQTQSVFRREPVYLDPTTIRRLFIEHVEADIGTTRAEEILDTIDHLEQLQDIRQLNQLFLSPKR